MIQSCLRSIIRSIIPCWVRLLSCDALMLLISYFLHQSHNHQPFPYAEKHGKAPQRQYATRALSGLPVLNSLGLNTCSLSCSCSRVKCECLGMASLRSSCATSAQLSKASQHTRNTVDVSGVAFSRCDGSLTGPVLKLGSTRERSRCRQSKDNALRSSHLGAFLG